MFSEIWGARDTDVVDYFNFKYENQLVEPPYNIVWESEKNSIIPPPPHEYHHNTTVDPTTETTSVTFLK